MKLGVEALIWRKINKCLGWKGTNENCQLPKAWETGKHLRGCYWFGPPISVPFTSDVAVAWMEQVLLLHFVHFPIGSRAIYIWIHPVMFHSLALTGCPLEIRQIPMNQAFLSAYWYLCTRRGEGCPPIHAPLEAGGKVWVWNPLRLRRELAASFPLLRECSLKKGRGTHYYIIPSGFKRKAWALSGS